MKENEKLKQKLEQQNKKENEKLEYKSRNLSESEIRGDWGGGGSRW